MGSRWIYIYMENKKIREKLIYSMKLFMNNYISKNNLYIARLASLNPYSVLNKGYSLVYTKGNVVLTSIDDISIDDEVKINMKDGSLIAQIKDKEKQND